MEFKFCKKLFLISFFTSQLYSYSGKTFFMPRPIQQDMVLQKTSSMEFVNRIYKNKKIDGLKILSSTFYKESTNSSDLASYFFPEGKTELSVQGPNVAGTPDISSTWLTITKEDEDLDMNFSSKISITPKQKSFGVNLQIFKNLNALNKRILLGISLPFEQIETDLNFKEYERSTNLENLPLDIQYKNASANAKEAFNNPLLTYGKMKDGVQKLAGLADIKISIDGLIKANNIVNINIYGFGIIPTGYHPKAEYLFAPVLGNGKHLSLGAGANLSANIWKNKYKKLLLSSGAEYQYLFEATNKRIFDLKNNGSFSRYLDVRRNDNIVLFQITDLVKISTLNCKITPRSAFNSFIDLSYLYKNCNIKLGYNFWWRNSEKLNLKDNLEGIYAITGMDLTAQGGIQLDQYFNNATIKNDASQNPADNFVAITNNDLDLDSGRAPSALSNKFYLNIGLDGNFSDKKYCFNSGISYEIAGKNSSLSNWEIFLQLGLAL